MKLQFAKLHVTKKELVVLIAVSLMSFLANLPEGVAGNLISRKTLLATLVAVVVIAMFRYLQVLLLAIISILAIGANLPRELAENLGVSQTAMIVSLALLVAITLLNRVLHVLPVSAESLETPDEDDTLDLSPASARQRLLDAIAHGDIATVRKLLAMDTTLINFTLNGTTPLHLATEKGYSSIVKLLIDHGADLLAQNAEGSTPLDVALALKKFAKTTEILYAATIPRLTSQQQ